MKGTLTGSIDLLRKATKKAMATNSALAGQTTTARNLKLYEGMDETTLNRIGQLYGTDNLLRYIRHMEAMRIKNGK